MRRTLRKIVMILDGQPRGRRGQSFVEMALTAPFLILMIVGLTEIGFMANNYLILMDAVREAGRKAVNLFPAKWDSYVPDASNTGSDYYDTSQDRNWDRTDCSSRHGVYNLYGDQDQGRDRNGVAAVDQSPVPASWVNGGWNTPPGTIAGHPLGSYGYSLIGANKGPFGFFDTVVCQALISMSPLYFDAGRYPAPYSSGDTGKDEIVVSAVSYMILPSAAVANNAITYSDGSPAKAIVTGRWPLQNRACYDAATWPHDSSKGDYRDPFDYLNPSTEDGSGTFTWSVAGNSYQANVFDIVNNPITNTNPNHWPSEDPLALNHNGPTYPVGSLKQPANGGTSGRVNGIRGFVLTGAYKAADGCLGSDFTVQDIEHRLDISSQVGDFNPMDPGMAAGLKQWAPNGGLVIVEIHWQHHPAFFGPIFEGFQNGRRDLDPMLNIFGMFPVTSAEPTVTP
ncbi:MAG TPA: TadE family protein [Aggregatilineales bacterium]|nr:TadE family protein [Aggregatilineales bacterium]